MSNPFGDEEGDVGNPFYNPSEAGPTTETSDNKPSSTSEDNGGEVEDQKVPETEPAPETSEAAPAPAGDGGTAEDAAPRDEAGNSDQEGGDNTVTEDTPAVTFSPQLEAAIAEVVTTTDPLDSPDFNPNDFINRMFPNEQSLSNIDAFVGKLKLKIRQVDRDILTAVSRQAHSGSRGRQDVVEAKRAIQELFEKIKQIRRKAEQSEVMVQEICRDIKSLDYAKRHLTATITTLKRLHMLVTAVGQLRDMSTSRQYREAANLLEATNQLFQHFEDNQRVPKIRELIDTVADVKHQLKKQIFEDFSSLSENTHDPLEQNPQLPDACLVVNALGPEAKDELIMWFCTLQLSGYKSIFKPSAEVSSLENTERRYAWLRRQLRTFDEQFARRGVFPPDWNVPQCISIDFCKTARKDLVEILDECISTVDVAVLLRCMHKTIEFEQELINLFGEDGGGDEDEDGDHDSLSSSSEEEDHAPGSAAAIRQKYRRQFKAERRAELAKNDPGRLKRREEAKARKAEKRVTFQGIISGCFEPYMASYVSHEDRTMGELIERLRREEKWTPDDASDTNQVLGSSTDVFLYIRASMKCCVSLSRGQAFFDLYKVYQKHLRGYAQLLASKLPKTTANSNFGASAGSDWHIKLSDRDLTGVCLIVSTSEYCFDTIAQLSDTVKKNIDEELSPSIDFSGEQDEFNTTLNTGIKILVLALETRLDGALSAMTKVNWKDFSNVGDESEYVGQIRQVLEAFIPLVAKLISAAYVKFFFDKFLGSFIPRYIVSLYKCKRINDVAAQQLLLDTHAIKTVLQALPEFASRVTPNEIRMTSSLQRYLKKEMTKAETLLKVLQTPIAGLLENYMALVPEHTLANFQKMLDLKGLKKSEQAPLLAEYSRVSPQTAQSPLPATSGKSIKRLLTGWNFPGTKGDSNNN